MRVKINNIGQINFFSFIKNCRLKFLRKNNLKMPIHVATHPLISHKLTVMRDVKTSSADFRKLLQEVTFYLGYEATRNLGTATASVTTPMGVTCEGSKINEKVSIVPILRAGLGLSNYVIVY